MYLHTKQKTAIQKIKEVVIVTDVHRLKEKEMPKKKKSINDRRKRNYRKRWYSIDVGRKKE